MKEENKWSEYLFQKFQNSHVIPSVSVSFKTLLQGGFPPECPGDESVPDMHNFP